MPPRPPPVGPQGPIPLYAAVAPSMSDLQISTLVRSPAFRATGVRLHVTEFDVLRLGLDRVEWALQHLPYTDHGTKPIVLSLQGVAGDYRASAIEAFKKLIYRLNPDALMVAEPDTRDDPNGYFLRDLHAILEERRYPVPHLYRACARPFGYALHRDRCESPGRMLMQCLSRAGIKDDRRQSFRSWANALVQDPHAHLTVIDGMVIPLDGTDDDVAFLRDCQEYLAQAQNLNR